MCSVRIRVPLKYTDMGWGGENWLEIINLDEGVEDWLERINMKI